MKVAVVTPIPTPYRDPFWSVVAGQPGVELHVFYCSAGKADRPWEVTWAQDYRAEVLRGWNLLKWRGPDAACFWNPGIIRRLEEGSYDALVLGGYNHPTMLAAARWAVRREVPYYLMCESYLEQPRAAWRRWVKAGLVRRIVTRAAGGFPTGVRARQYLIRYGAAPESLALLPNVPDVAALHRKARELAPQRDALRRQHGLVSGPVVLFAARMIAKKRSDLLVRAFGLACRSTEATLVLVGDGPERASVEELVDQIGLRSQVRFVGFVQPADVPAWHAMADLFVLPSSETWGVAVLEALASGLPVIITDEVGCGPDVLTDPRLGAVVRAGDEEELILALRNHLQGPTARRTVEEIWGPMRETLAYERVAERFTRTLGASGHNPDRVAVAGQVLRNIESRG